jgi:hypothetical protein
MKTCEACQAVNAPEANFCSLCRAPFERSLRSAYCEKGHAMHPSWHECLECRGERSQIMDYSEPPRMPTLMEPAASSSPRGATVVEVSPQPTPANMAASLQTTGPIGTTRVVKPREAAASSPTSPAPAPVIRRETQFGGAPIQTPAVRPAGPTGSVAHPAGPAAEVEKKLERRIVGVLLTYTWRPEGQLFPVREGRNRIGRNSECEICLPEDPHLSGTNSHITYRRNFTLGDLVSMGGTDLNGEPVEETHLRLPNYSQIRAGSTHFTFIEVDPGIAVDPGAGTA